MLSGKSHVIRAPKAALRHVTRFMDRIVVAAGYVGAILAVVMALAIVYDVVLRFFFNRPTTWALDLVRYLLICITLLLAAWVLRGEGHVKIDIIVRLLKPKTQAIISCVTGVLIMVACAIFFWQSAKATWADYNSGVMTGYSWDIPRATLMMVITIGSFLLLWQTIRRFQLQLNEATAMLRTKKGKTDSNSLTESST